MASGSLTIRPTPVSATVSLSSWPSIACFIFQKNRLVFFRSRKALRPFLRMNESGSSLSVRAISSIRKPGRLIMCSSTSLRNDGDARLAAGVAVHDKDQVTDVELEDQ